MSTSIPEGRKPVDNVDIFQADLEAGRAVCEGSDVSLTIEELNFLDQQPTSRASVRYQRGYVIDLVILSGLR